MTKKSILGAFVLVLAVLALPSCSKESAELEVETEGALNLLNRDDAIEFILNKVDLSEDEVVQVRLLPQMLRPNSIIDEANADERRFADDYEWFAVIDRKPGAFVNHPFDYVYLNYETQELIVRRQSDYPVINGEPIWKTSADYFKSADLVYSNAGEEGSSDRLGFKGGGQESVTAGLHEFFAKKPAGAEDDCKHSKRRYALLLYNQAEGIPGEDIRANLDSMQAALQMNGYEVVSFAKDDDPEQRVFSIDIGTDNGRGLYRIRHFVSKHEDARSCCDEIVVYYTGSVGIEQTRRGPIAYIEAEFNYGGESSSRKPKKRIYGKDLRDLFDGLKTCHLNFVIDSNNAAGFVPELSKVRSLESLVASSEMGEYAYSGVFETADDGKIMDPYGRDDGETGSEFTSGFAKGLVDYVSADLGDAKVLSSHEVISIGFSAALENDIAYIAGATHPVGYVRGEETRCRCVSR